MGLKYLKLYKIKFKIFIIFLKKINIIYLLLKIEFFCVNLVYYILVVCDLRKTCGGIGLYLYYFGGWESRYIIRFKL